MLSEPRGERSKARGASPLAGLGVAALLALRAALVAQAATPPAPAVLGVDSVGVTVSDVDRATDFYALLLGFEKVADREVAGERYEHLFGVFGLRLRAVRLRLGTEYLELMQFFTPRGRPIPVDSRSNDRWFQHIAIVTNDMAAAYERLRSYHVEHASTGPQRLPDWNRNAAGIEAFYFRDPDGHNLEIIAFPPGKGLAKWQARSGRLFLGIDHTAIVIADTEASLRFYRDGLGLQVVGTSENHGPEQEHLNNVFGARLRITSLRGSQGPGVEFLEYLVPRTGRALPSDTAANDLWYWEINLCGADPVGLEERLLRSRVPLISTRVTEIEAADFPWQAALLARDPDGHASLLARGCTAQ